MMGGIVDRTSLELWRASRAGDRASLGELLARHLPALRAFVRLRMSADLRLRESASDLVQSTCRELLEAFEELEDRGEDAFRGWLFTAVHNKLRRRERDLRAQKRDVRREREIEAVGGDAEIASLYSTAMSPSEVAIGAEAARSIEAAFDAMPDDYREVLTLSRVARVPRREIARIMGRSEDSVRNLLTRALIELSRRLDREG